MKRFFKIITSFFLIIILILGGTYFIFKDEISVYKNIASKLWEFKENPSSIENFNSLEPLGSMDYKDIVYKDDNNVPLSLDIYSAKKQLRSGSPVIIYVHGGSWVYGDKSIPTIISPLLQSLQEEGFTIISTSYELLNENITLDKQIQDVKDTIRWVYQNKDEYNFNTDKIGLIGISSGAHLSLMAGFTDNNEFKGDADLQSYSSNVDYIIDLFGPTDLTTLPLDEVTFDLNKVLKANPNLNELLPKYSPINYTKSNLPETLIIHSKDDPIVPYSNSEELNRKLIESGNKSELLLFETGGHDLTTISQEDAFNFGIKVLNFIVKNM